MSQRPSLPARTLTLQALNTPLNKRRTPSCNSNPSTNRRNPRSPPASHLAQSTPLCRVLWPAHPLSFLQRPSQKPSSTPPLCAHPTTSPTSRACLPVKHRARARVTWPRPSLGASKAASKTHASKCRSSLMSEEDCLAGAQSVWRCLS